MMPVHRFENAEHGDAGRRDGHPVSDASGEPTGPEALRRAFAELEELAAYVRLYLAARWDAIVAMLRRLGLWLVAAVAGLAVLSALLATSAVIGVLGLAQLIGQALGDRPWAGYLVTGFGLLAVFAVALVAAIVIVERRFHKKTVRKYARRHEQQRARYGRDASERAASR